MLFLDTQRILEKQAREICLEGTLISGNFPIGLEDIT